jgi:hypothetical protein
MGRLSFEYTRSDDGVVTCHREGGVDLGWHFLSISLLGMSVLFSAGAGALKAYRRLRRR